MRELWHAWLPFCDRLETGIAARTKDRARTPYDKKNPFLKREVYAFVLDTLNRPDAKQLGNILEYYLGHSIGNQELTFGDNPFYWILTALNANPKIAFSRKDIKPFSEALILAFRFQIPTQLLVAFLHQYGGRSPPPPNFDLLQSGSRHAEIMNQQSESADKYDDYFEARAEIVSGELRKFTANGRKSVKGLSAIIQKEIYEIVHLYTLRKRLYRIERSVKESGRAPRAPDFKANPYYWTLIGIIRLNGLISSHTLSVWANQTLYAHKNHVPSFLLDGFNHQVGGIREVRRKNKFHRRENWLRAYLAFIEKSQNWDFEKLVA